MESQATLGWTQEEDATFVGFVKVAVERGVDAAQGGLTYALPEGLSDVRVGQRVRVPLGRGNKPAVGMVVERLSEPGMDRRKIKPVLGLAPGSEGGALPEDLVELGRWIAKYYVCPLGMVYSAMSPAAVRQGVGTVERRVVRPAESPPEKKLTKLQQAVVNTMAGDGAVVLESHDGWFDEREVADAAGAKTVGPVRRLVELGVLEGSSREAVEARALEELARQTDERPDGEGDSAAALSRKRLELTGDQQSAMDHLLGPAGLDAGFGVHLLHGVTGSGKTEVYLRLIEGLQKRKPEAGIVVLVPEIALTPQTVARFVGRLERVAVLHSGLTPAQRHVQWRRVAAGQVDVVVGARSAVFAPLKYVSLIIVDEEHDSSYKQDQLPRYHARDVAIKRAQLAGAMVVLGSATPSLESYSKCEVRSTKEEANQSQTSHFALQTSHFHYLPMPTRVAGATLPEVEIVDLIEERRHRRGVHLLSQALEQRLRDTLDAGGQAMLLLNRRGYANYLACPAHTCGWQMTCDHCDATMVYHVNSAGDPATGNRGMRGLTRCHHCEAEQVLPEHCPLCSRKVTVFGLGTQRVEEELAAKFPGLRAERMDSDTMRRAEDYRRVLAAFGAGHIDVLMGTQMIAKGLDYPNVRLVGVISADTALHLPDFRASERTFQLVAQVAGRAGRSEHPGRVVVQTFSPEEPAILRAAEHDYHGFAAAELAIREQSQLPPSTRMTRVVCRDLDLVIATKHATETAALLRAAARDLGIPLKLRGPAACPLSRVADHHRMQVELTTATAGQMQKLLTEARNRGGMVSDAKTAVDVDPISLL